MKNRKLKPWVINALILTVIFVFFLQLLLINIKLNKLISKDNKPVVVLEMGVQK